MSNHIYIAVSLDGFIARTDGSIDWLTNIENPDNTDYGYKEFMDTIDAIVMGRKTFEFINTVEPWPFNKPVFVLSSTLPSGMSKPDKYTIVNSKPGDLLHDLKAKGFNNLYIDGGRTIQSFLAEDLIDELIITRVPILLGSGIPLFGNSNVELKLKHVNTEAYPNGLVKSRYIRA